MTSRLPTARIAINALTDVSVFFAIGNAMIGNSMSLLSTVLNWITPAIEMTVRAGSEYVNAGGRKWLPQRMRNFLSNRGAALQVRGVFQAVSSLHTLATKGLSDPPALHDAAMFGCFSISNLSRGTALKFNELSAPARVLNCVGVLSGSVVGALMTIGPGISKAVPATFIGAGAASLLQLFNNRFARTITTYQIPDVMCAAASFTVAATSPDPTYAVSNMLYGCAFLSLMATRKFNGVVQAGEALAIQARSQVKPLALTALIQYETLRHDLAQMRR